MKIGILTGGGDCPGLNAVIRAVVRKGIFHYSDQFVGFLEGWRGLVEDKSMVLDLDTVSGILPRGGTILRTSRTNPSKKPDGLDRCIATIEKHKIDALIAIGGDDTLSVAQKLYERGVKVIGVPKTIDNDLPFTDNSPGFGSVAKYVAVSILEASLDVAATITHHDASRQIDFAVSCGIDQHLRLRLAAVANFGLGMRAHLDAIDRQRQGQQTVHLIDNVKRHQPVADIRLIGDDDQEITRRLQSREQCCRLRVDLERFETARRVTAAVSHFGNDENAVAVEKHRAFRFGCPRHHLVFRTCNAGWLTRQCHTTA